MTIQNRDLNEQLSDLENCAERAPQGTYKIAHDVVEVINDTIDQLISSLHFADLKHANNDSLRDLQACIYGYIKAANPDIGLVSAEGFGKHIDGAAGARIYQQAERDRDYLNSVQTTIDLMEINDEQTV